MPFFITQILTYNIQDRIKTISFVIIERTANNFLYISIIILIILFPSEDNVFKQILLL